MNITHDTQLTSSEVCFLCGIYLGDTLSICINKYFLQHIQEKNIKTVVKSLPFSGEHDVTDSTASPFSDKLMMYLLGFIRGAGNYGVSNSTSMRSNLTVYYSRLLTEVLKYSEDGLNIMIKNGWFEQPPLASYRVKG